MRWLNGFYDRKNIRWSVFVCMAMAFSVSVNAAPDWPNYLGPNNDLQPELKQFTTTTADEVWRVQLKTGMGSVSIANGLLYTIGTDGTKENEETARDYV